MNTDRDLVLELSKSGRLPAPLASNPLAQELGGEILELSTESGLAMLAFNPPARFAQGGGVLQGGIITALLDFAMAFAAHAKLRGEERGFATASMSIQFLRAAPPARYVAHGRIVRAGRKLLFAEARLVAASAPDDLIATASAVLALAER
ncbi:MAG TPA: PaaI family thioesterase [Steroidobacteraceae bacterium]|nr:PaaI family thioesterase [Steroidobacteraceae bacterium]